MAGRIAENFIAELLVRVDIVDVIQRRVPLKKAGHEWQACCPFHDERTPSFTVSPQKQFYHCFGCGAHGSAIGFLMNYEHLAFQDAVEDLAQAVGMKVEYDGPGPGRPREDRTDMYALLEQAADWYHARLKGDEQAQAYCRERGLDADIIERFSIGWAPAGWDGLIKRLGASLERLRLLEQAGMVSTGSRGKKYDRFRERLMFPINDRRGRVIAFGGRVVSAEASPKYLNSPETPLFHKGRELFGLWQVRQRNAKLERILVVEGYMDVVALHQAGVPVAVATLGTATTPEHAEKLFRTAPMVVFCFDGDRAGRDAAWKALNAALPHLRDGRQAGFLFLPDGEDPDSLVRKEGADGFHARMDAATPLSEYFFATLSDGIRLDHIDGKARLAELARPLIAQLPDGAFRDLMVDELGRRTGAGMAPAPKAVRVVAQPGDIEGHHPSLVRRAVTLLLAKPAMAAAVQPPYAFVDLKQPGIGVLVALLDRAREHPEQPVGVLLEHFRERREYRFLQRLAAQHLSPDLNLDGEFAGAIERLGRQTIDQRIGQLLDRQAETGLDAAGKAELRELLACKASG